MQERERQTERQTERETDRQTNTLTLKLFKNSFSYQCFSSRNGWQKLSSQQNLASNWLKRLLIIPNHLPLPIIPKTDKWWYFPSTLTLSTPLGSFSPEILLNNDWTLVLNRYTTNQFAEYLFSTTLFFLIRTMFIRTLRLRLP